MKFVIIVSSLVVLMVCGDLVNGKHYPGVPRLEGGLTMDDIREEYRTLCVRITLSSKSSVSMTGTCEEPRCSAGFGIRREGDSTKMFPKCCPKFACNG